MNTQTLGSAFFVLLVVLVLLTIFGIVYLYITAKSRERLALIEKGMDPNLASSDFWVQVSIIGGGAALGLMLGGWVPGGFGPLWAILVASVGLIVYNLSKKNNARRRQ